MKKKYLPLLLLLSQTYNSQSIPSNNNYGLPQIVAPSQETFANSRINFENSSSGEFTYQYPVFNNIQAPISLNYTSGVRVDDIGTSTGMSWQLNAGGVISRVVRDETDENKTNWKPESINEVADLQKIKDAARIGNAIDTEYDWFNFSISNGLSGSFYIDKDLNVFIESKDKVKIEITIKNAPVSVYGKLLEFKLTDKAGNEYYFGGTDLNIEKTVFQNAGPDQQAITGWYLYKIINSDKKETIFTYAVENLNYYTSLNASFNVQQNCSPPIPEGPPYTYSDIIKSRSTIQSFKPKLMSILEDDKQINFIYNKERKDLFNNNPENNLLTSIEVKSNNRVIDTYYLEYFDTQSSVAATYYGLPSNESSTRNRHFLKSVKNVNKNIQIEFDYYDLASLPSRFSLASDYYGYPNGKSNTSPFPAIAQDNNFGIFKGFSNVMPLSMLSADKTVSPLLASVGNLKKIIHPTKGISEIFYEANSTSLPFSEAVKEVHSLVANYNSCDPANDTPLDSFTFVSNGSYIEFHAEAAFDDFAQCNEPDSHHDRHRLKITNLTTGVVVYQGSNYHVSVPLIAELGTNYYPVSTVAGQTYKVEYSVVSAVGAVTGWAMIKYNEHNVITNKMQYYGGSRVSSIKESDIEGHNYIRKFYYNPLVDINNPKTSIADFNPIYIMAQKQETSRPCVSSNNTFPVVEIVNIYSAYQNSLLPMFNHRRNKIFYTDITEIIENKSAVEKKFSYYDNVDPYIGRPPAIYNIPNTNSGELKSNLLLEENIYKFENVSFSKLINKTYKYDYSQVKNLKSYVFRENFTYYPDPAQDQLLNISHGFYENYYGFYNLTEIKTTEYFPNNIMLMTTNTNVYANPSHYQLTSSKTQLPDNTIQETTYSYAHEKGNQLMIEKNMIGIPLETVSTQTIGSAVKTLSKTSTIYPVSQTEANTKTSGLVLPTSILSYDLQNLSTARTEVSYDKYDAKGNILQYTTKDGVPVAIVWGYNNTQPIAKVEGATYDQLVSLGVVTAIVDASNADALNPAQEGALITALDTFRKNSGLSGYQISTYTYNPLIGVTSITPPSGIRESYIYDTANRLEKVVDVNGNVLKEMKYNYKN